MKMVERQCLLVWTNSLLDGPHNHRDVFCNPETQGRHTVGVHACAFLCLVGTPGQISVSLLTDAETEAGKGLVMRSLDSK